MKPARARVASIRSRLAQALLWWTLAWGLGVALAVGYASRYEVQELLDESLHATALVLARAIALAGNDALDVTPQPVINEADFAWQLVSPDGAVLRRSSNAPERALQPAPTAGFSDAPGWRVFGVATGRDGRLLYAAHTQRERDEAQAEVALSAVLAALSIGLIGHVWLRLRVRRELQPLEALSARLATHDPLAGSLATADRAELVPVQQAIDELGRRLARRLAHERAFAAHAAHALRTPLAGMEAQLAVALRESPPGVQQRLQQVREASGRLQRVVRSLLDLFRVGAEARPIEVDLEALLAHLPVEGLEVRAPGHTSLRADPDLLAAALSNLLDNARRHGARQVVVSEPSPGTLRLQDDGSGASPERRRQIQAALAAQDYEQHTGLGLMLADLVARAHGGALTLPEVTQGFAAELRLGAAPAEPHG
jgi:signal transduction histidine kinase